MDLSSIQSALQEGSEQMRLTQSLQEQKAALQEGKMPRQEGGWPQGQMSAEQRDIDRALIPAGEETPAPMEHNMVREPGALSDIAPEQEMKHAVHPETGEVLEIHGEPVGSDGLLNHQREQVNEQRALGDYEGADEMAQFERGGNRADWERLDGRDWPEGTRWPGEYG